MKRLLHPLLWLTICTLGITQSKAVTYFLKASGSPTVPSSWNTSPLGTGSNATSFAGASALWVFQVSGTRTAVTLTSGFLTHSTATAVIGSGFNLTVSGNGLLTAWINARPTSTITILNTRAYKLSNLNLTSTVIYGVGSGSVTSPRFAQPFGNLRVSTSLRLSGSTGTQVSVAGELILDAGVTLSLTNVPLLMTGQGATMFSGTGVLFGGTSSVLRLSGGNGGDNGTLLMSASAPTLNTLSLQFSSASNFITLGSALTVRNGTFDMQTGNLNLNGNNLQIISAGVRLPASSASGVFFANPASAIHVRTPTSFTNNQLFFHSSLNTLGSLTYSSSTLTMGVGSPLILLDSLAVNAGTLQSNGQITIEANSSKRGRIARSNGSISGNVTVRNFISGGNSGWMLLGVDGVTGNNVSSWDTWFSSGGANGFPMTCTGCSYGTAFLNFQSIHGWSEAANDYDSNVGASTALVPGVGYWVFVGDSKYITNDLNVLNTGPANMASGSFVLSVSGSDPGHLNLLANPYASPISWRKLYAGRNNNNVDPVIYIYSPDAGGSGYRTFNANTSASTNGLTDVIPTGQGFYVSTSAAATMTFNQSVKLSDNTTNLSRTANTETDQQFVKILISGPSANDETMVYFDELATNTFDRMFDARKMFGTPPIPGKSKDFNPHGVIYTKDVVGISYAINSIPPVNGTVTIPMSVRISQDGEHAISAPELMNYSGGVLLKDREKGIYHNLEEGSYTFRMNVNDNPDRFELILYQKTAGQTVSVTELNKSENIVISQDARGVFVKTRSDNNSSKTTISAFNIVGQQIMKDVEVVGAVTETYLDLDASNQVVIIRATSNGGETSVKKVIVK